MCDPLTADISVCTFNRGMFSEERIIITAGLENYVGSTFGELLMGLPHSPL